MTIDPIVAAGIFGYAVLTAVWSVTLYSSVVRGRVSRATNPLVSRLYLVLTAGSVCAIAACINDITRLIFSTGALGGTPIEPVRIVGSMMLPFIANATALTVALAVALRKGIPQIEHDALGLEMRQHELAELVAQRTNELSESVRRLEHDRREREEIEQKLRADNAMLDGIMQTSIGAICVVNAEGRIVFANNTAQSVLGVSVHDITQRSYDSPEWDARDLEGKPLAEDQKPFRRVISARAPIHNMKVSIAGDGDARRFLEVNGAPLSGADGELTGAVFLVADVSQRMADEVILRNSEKRFQQMVEDLPSGAVFVEGDYTYLNRAAEEITGYSRNELATVDQWFWALYGEKSAEARRKYEAVRDAGFVEVCVGTIRRKDGEMRTIECGGYKSNNATVWLLHDISEQDSSKEIRRRFESHLMETQSLDTLAVMAEGVAHDCNNILTGILGSAELARHELTTRDSALQYIEEMAVGAERAADLCTMMLAFAGASDQKFGPVDVNAAVREMVRFTQGAESDGTPARFQYHLDETAGHAQADGAQIRKVLLALLKNSMESLTEGRGTITISTNGLDVRESLTPDVYENAGLPAGHYVRISVKDNGCGMDAATRAKAFEPFFTTKNRSRGLGLTDALGIVRASSGNITLESATGSGTTVNIYLPTAFARTIADEPTRASGELRQGSGTILVVDDEAEVLRITKRMLERLGYDVVLASDGKEAIAAIDERNDIAVVILDLTLPTTDGGRTLSEIRAKNPALPVLITSGYDINKVTGRFRNSGVAGYLQKPFDLRDLSERVRAALERNPEKLPL